MKKTATYSLILIVVIIIVVKIFSFNSEKACGKFIGKTYVRGDYFEYAFYIKGKRYTGIFEDDSSLELNDLKDLTCVKVSYSEWFPSFNKIEKKDILLESNYMTKI
ncbi:MAG: hypothetical protein ACK476_07670 [Fluviicola sp.]